MNLTPFDKPIYISRPLLPNLDEFTERLKEIWDSKWLANSGPQHVAFEKELSDKLKVPFTSLFNNGTIALIIACQSLRLSGEVITTPFTFPATVHTLIWNNIRPVFCDIDPITMNIDVSKLESLITPQTTAILGVHLFGQPCNVSQIQGIADRYGLKVLYDAAHVFGVELCGQGIGNFGDVSMISFHATKIFHTAEGGALMMKDKVLKERVDYLKNFGIKNEEEVVMPGINGKMSELHAALGLVNLKYVDEEVQKRKRLYEVYVQGLMGLEGIDFNVPEANVKSNYQYFVIRIDPVSFGKTRDEVHELFEQFNVFTRKYFYPLCSNYPCYRSLPSASPSLLPVANKVANQVLCLPLYGGLDTEDVTKICRILKAIGDGRL
jgi:dTDP-4-amino-4,6-dideoxygalactose transaminase